MKIAVTAASGHLGAAIVKHLLKQVRPDQVVGLARTPDNAKDLGVEIRTGDYGEPDPLKAVLFLPS